MSIHELSSKVNEHRQKGLELLKESSSLLKLSRDDGLSSSERLAILRRMSILDKEAFEEFKKASELEHALIKQQRELSQEMLISVRNMRANI